MENYKDALESSTEVSCTGDSGEDSTRDLVGIQWGIWYGPSRDLEEI